MSALGGASLTNFPPVVVESMRDLMPHDGPHPAVVDVQREFRVEHVVLEERGGETHSVRLGLVECVYNDNKAVGKSSR